MLAKPETQAMAVLAGLSGRRALELIAERERRWTQVRIQSGRDLSDHGWNQAFQGRLLRPYVDGGADPGATKRL
jgi:hypothetical protein